MSGVEGKTTCITNEASLTVHTKACRYTPLKVQIYAFASVCMYMSTSVYVRLYGDLSMQGLIMLQ